MKNFENKVPIVCGGTSGLGAATAIYFAESGAKVYAVGLKAFCLLMVGTPLCEVSE